MQDTYIDALVREDCISSERHDGLNGVVISRLASMILANLRLTNNIFLLLSQAIFLTVILLCV